MIRLPSVARGYRMSQKKFSSPVVQAGFLKVISDLENNPSAIKRAYGPD